MKRVWQVILLTLAAAAPLMAADAPTSDVGKPIVRDAIVASPAAPNAAPASTAVELDSGRVALALIGVIGLILLLRYAAKLMFPSVISAGRHRSVTVLARCPLAPRQQVVLIQVGRRIVVAADCGSQLSSLCQITDADEVAALIGQIQSNKTAPIGSPFTAWFNRAAEAFGVEHAGDEAESVPEAESEDIGKLTERVRGLARQWASENKKAPDMRV